MVMHEIGGILTLIIGGAIFIAMLSKNANTSAVLDSSFGGFSKLINAMTSPVSG